MSKSLPAEKLTMENNIVLMVDSIKSANLSRRHPYHAVLFSPLTESVPSSSHRRETRLLTRGSKVVSLRSALAMSVQSGGIPPPLEISCCQRGKLSKARPCQRVTDSDTAASVFSGMARMLESKKHQDGKFSHVSAIRSGKNARDHIPKYLQ